MDKAQASNKKNDQPKVVPWDKPTDISQQEAEAILYQEGYQSFCWFDLPGASYPRHRHDCDECLWILKGEITFTINEQAYLLQKGDRIYLPALTPHKTTVSPSGSVTFLVGQKPRSG